MDIERKQKTMVKFGDLKKGDTFIVNLPNDTLNPMYIDCVCVKIINYKGDRTHRYVSANLTYNEINPFNDDKIVEKINVKLVETD